MQHMVIWHLIHYVYSSIIDWCLLQHLLNAFERHGHFWQIYSLLYIPVMGLNRLAEVWYLFSCTTPSHAQPDPAEKVFFNATTTFKQEYILRKKCQLINSQYIIYLQTANTEIFLLGKGKLFISSEWFYFVNSI